MSHFFNLLENEMRIWIKDKQKQIGSSATEHIMDKVEAAFSKFGQHVVSVDLIIEDVNGPRGGIDKKCQLLVNIRGMKSVVVSTKKASASRAIAKAIAKAKRTTNRKLKRRSMRSARRQPSLALAYRTQ
jgi:ribosome-associated translation inhibitor RaiA